MKPTPSQLAWHQAELTMFLHFGMNTFTDREWGDGQEDPKLFAPTDLDARQWVQVAKETGFRYVILTAKHHDGFCLWPSKYTDHSVKNSPWRGGKGDVVREFADACHEAKLKLGLYLSPWDRHEPTYGDSPAYNRYYVNQLTELLTQYGEVAEVWLDGANGEGPNGKRQEYDFDAFKATIRKHQPKAVIFAPFPMTPDIRWIGNEDGVAGDPCWATLNLERALEIERTEGWGPKLQGIYQHGDPDGTHWMPGESDVSLRPGWFWHEAEDSKLKSLDHLVDLYFKSVGRNSLLLLNVPPNWRGLLSDPDVQRLREFRATLDRLFAHNLAQGKPAFGSLTDRRTRPTNAVDGNPRTFWSPLETNSSPSLEIDLGAPTTFDTALAMEQIAEGQCVESYRLEAWKDGDWKEVARGTTIGHKRLDRFPPVTARRVRWSFSKSRPCPCIQTLGLYHSGKK